MHLWKCSNNSSFVYFPPISCFIDPQHQGVTIYELCGTYRKEMVVDGRQPLSKNTNPHHIKSMGVRRRENNFEFRSRNSQVRILLETVRDSPPQQAFKFNYVLTLWADSMNQFRMEASCKEASVSIQQNILIRVNVCVCDSEANQWIAEAAITYKIFKLQNLMKQEPVGLPLIVKWDVAFQ